MAVSRVKASLAKKGKKGNGDENAIFLFWTITMLCDEIRGLFQWEMKRNGPFHRKVSKRISSRLTIVIVENIVLFHLAENSHRKMESSHPPISSQGLSSSHHFSLQDHPADKPERRAQNRFGGMRLKMKAKGRMRNTRHFRGRIRDEIVLAGPGCIPFGRSDVGCFEVH